MNQTPTVTDRRTCPKCGGPKDPRSVNCAGCREVYGVKGPRPSARGPRNNLIEVVEKSKLKSERDGDCILTTAWKPTAKGYIRAPRVDERPPQMLHRLIAEQWLQRRLEPDETVDHTCHNGTDCPGGPTCQHRRCVNPAHLEVVSAVENWRRGGRGAVAKRVNATHCPYGHPYEKANLRANKKGHRACKACHRARQAGRPLDEEPTYLP